MTKRTTIVLDDGKTLEAPAQYVSTGEYGVTIRRAEQSGEVSDLLPWHRVQVVRTRSTRQWMDDAKY